MPRVEKAALLSDTAPHRNTVFVPQSWFKSLQLQEGQTMRWRCGFENLSLPVTVFPNTTAKAVMHASDPFLQSLMLSSGMNVCVRNDQGTDQLAIGPLIGIMAKPNVKNGELTGQQEPVFRRLLAAAESRNAIAYVFSPQDIEWARGRVKGYWLGAKPAQGSAKWKSRPFPLPDVVYDQIVSRAFDRRTEVQQTKERLYKLLSPRYFNQGFFDKWQMTEWLSSDRRSQSFVPETVRYSGPSQPTALLSKYDTVFLKPIHGTHGVGIIKLSRYANGNFYFQLKSRDRGVSTGTAKSVQQALAPYKKRLVQTRYVVQRGVPLLTYHNRPFDIRVLVQKDSTGSWRRSKIFARVAPDGDFTSNLTTGGEALSVRHVLRASTRDEKIVQGVIQTIQQLTKLIPAVTEEQSGQHLGELGIDLGIDERFRVWIIEVNSKPWKSPTSGHLSERIVVRAFERPMEYASYLSGYEPAE